jgi:hypothetical protein
MTPARDGSSVRQEGRSILLSVEQDYYDFSYSIRIVDRMNVLLPLMCHFDSGVRSQVARDFRKLQFSTNII